MRWLAAALLLLFTPGAARATTFVLENVQYNAAAQATGLGIALPPISLTIAADAVARGSFAFSAATGPLRTTGDIADMVAFRVGTTTIGPDGAGGLYTRLDLSLTFAPNGVITSALIEWLGPLSAFDLVGTGASVSGTVSPSDGSLCGYDTSPQFDCELTGQLVDPPDPPAAPIPEPGALLLAATIVSLHFVLRRRRR